MLVINPIYEIAVNELGLKGIDSNGDRLYFRDLKTGKDVTSAGEKALIKL